MNYIRAHWRGELSLVRTYWLNVVLVSIVLRGVEALGARGVQLLSVHYALSVAVLFWVMFGAIMVWQLVGLWRSATNHSATTGRRFWAGVAKVLIVLNVGNWLYQSTTAGIDVSNALLAVLGPDFSEYSVTRLEETDLIFTGALNDDSVDETIDYLKDPAILILRMSSHGGLVEPAVRLARFVRDNNVDVLAEDQCVSACVLVLAASQNAAVYPETEIIFHKTQPLAAFRNREIVRESEKYIAAAGAYDEEFGIPNWVSAKLKEQEY